MAVGCVEILGTKNSSQARQNKSSKQWVVSGIGVNFAIEIGRLNRTSILTRCLSLSLSFVL